MYPMTCTRPDLAYPLSIVTHLVAPGRHRKEHSTAVKRVLRYMASTSGFTLAGLLATDLGEPPRSPPVLYVDSKAMFALCREQRLEHRTMYIAANTADVFTKALGSGDHQRFCTALGLEPSLPHLLVS
ncbi:unnamed protein product [Closterium sp. NIES-53]